MAKKKPLKIEPQPGAPVQADFERAELEKIFNREPLHAVDGMRITALHQPPQGSLAGYQWAIWELLVTLIKERS